MADDLAPGRSLDQPDPSRLPADHPDRATIVAAHAAAMAHGEPGYTDPRTVLYVFTAA